ncbi:hypothetical protein RF11_10921 [Thelohanellus kitauei]|uniref:Tc1-like transposase DDE domain-containing protein n=1 Tax=Thelohanellus kitauei TaxID=669202 RepID=A0A0C2ISW1_THEKT|nr:hypothetical protein RF11_10921 [Thelohanellus kitauei]
MDNVPFHTDASIKCLITAWGHEVLYLPPYHSFLNPIENMFSQLKSIVRSFRPNSENYFMNQIHSATNLTPDSWRLGAVRPRCDELVELIDTLSRYGTSVGLPLMVPTMVLLAEAMSLRFHPRGSSSCFTFMKIILPPSFCMFPPQISGPGGLWSVSLSLANYLWAFHLTNIVPGQSSSWYFSTFFAFAIWPALNGYHFIGLKSLMSTPYRTSPSLQQEELRWLAQAKFRTVVDQISCCFFFENGRPKLRSIFTSASKFVENAKQPNRLKPSHTIPRPDKYLGGSSAPSGYGMTVSRYG